MLDFKVPLEVSGVVVAKVVDEFRDAFVRNTVHFFIDYQAVWWKLFHSPDASDWMNALKLARLLFSLPVSNGKHERVFSTMKNNKQEKRSSMSNELLDDLLVTNVEKVNVEDFNPDDSIELWWKNPTPKSEEKKGLQKEMQSESAAATTSSGVD